MKFVTLSTDEYSDSLGLKMYDSYGTINLLFPMGRQDAQEEAHKWNIVWATSVRDVF